nr:protein gle1 [Quercus suber]
MDRKFDTQYQQKIAEALDNHLTTVQRDHELRSQIEERRIRSDAAYEEAKRKEKASHEEKLRQEKAKAESELLDYEQTGTPLALPMPFLLFGATFLHFMLTLSIRLHKTLLFHFFVRCILFSTISNWVSGYLVPFLAGLDEAKRAALEAERRATKEAAERLASETSTRVVARVAQEDAGLQMNANAGTSSKVLWAAESALNFEQARLHKFKEVDERNQALRLTYNKDLSSYEKLIKRSINQIRRSTKVVSEKACEIVKIFHDPHCPQSVGMAAFAKKVLSYCISPDNDAFACAYVIVLVTSQRLDTNKSLGKRGAFSELLKLLESSGMSRHKSIYMEGQHKSWWFLEPSYDGQHLLLTQSRLAPGALDVAAASKFRSFPHETLVAEWKTANEYYFKSIASVLLLQQICLNSHKDITCEQVDRLGAFLNQLIEIQQMQQVAVNDFARQLKRLRESVSTLENLYPNSPTTDIETVSVCHIKYKHGTLKCLWQQKELFDGLCAMLNEASLVLRTFEDTHLNTCHGVKAAANRVLAFIGKFVPDFQKSKEALDYYLLGQNRSTATLASTSHCYVITKQMEQLVSQNFQAIKNHFEVVFRKGELMEEEYNSMPSINELTEGNSSGFVEALNSTFEHITDALRRLGSSSSGQNLPEELVGNITSWEFPFDSFVVDLRLDLLCEKLLKTMFYVEKLLNHSSIDISSNSQIGAQYKHLHVSLNIILNFGYALLQDLLAMYRTALVYIQGRYTKVNIDNNTEENVTLELVKSGIFEFGVLLELLYQNLSSASLSSFLNLFAIIVSSFAAAPPPHPVPAQGRSGSVMGSLGATIADGLAWVTGTSIAHRAMDALMGPRVIKHETVASSASDALIDCLEGYRSDISKCEFYMDMLHQCCQNSGTLSA